MIQQRVAIPRVLFLFIYHFSILHHCQTKQKTTTQSIIYLWNKIHNIAATTSSTDTVSSSKTIFVFKYFSIEPILKIIQLVTIQGREV